MAHQSTPDVVDFEAQTTVDLTALPRLALSNGCRVWVAAAGVTHGLWCLDNQSVAVTNGTTVVATSDGTGRWIYFGSSAFANISVANEAALTAFDVSGQPDGADAYVQTHRSYWTLRTQAVALVPHEIIASADGTKQWIREIPRQHWSWTLPTAWFINFATGDDEAVGTTNGTPLQTWAEFRRRTIYVTRSMQGAFGGVTIMGDLDPTDVMEWEPIVQSEAQVLVTIKGTVTLGANHIVVGANTLAQAGNEAALLDAGFAFTPGEIVQATSGAINGYTAVVLQLIAGTQFRTTKWMDTGGNISNSVPANGVNVAVQTLPIVPEICLSSRSMTFQVNSLNIVQVDATMSLGPITYFKCQYNGYSAVDTFAASQGCSIGGFFFIVIGNRSRQTFSGCGFVAPYGLTIQGEGMVYIDQSVFVETNVGIGNPAIDVSLNGWLGISGLGIFSTDTGTMLDVHNGGVCDVQGGTLYGTSATALFATRVREGSTMTIQTAVTPTLTSTAGGFVMLDIDAQANLLPPIIAAAAVPNLAVCQTWAAWAAGPFNRTFVGIGSAVDGTSKATGTRVITHA